MEELLQQMINNFDFAYMFSINVLTYILIKIVDYFNKDKKVSLLIKRLILIFSIILLCILYKFTTNIDNNVLINSTIAAPVFYSWVLKPILKKYNLNYNEGVEIK